MKTHDIGEAGSAITRLIEEAGDGPIVLTCHDKPVAVLLPVKNADLETIALSLDTTFLDILEKSKRRLRSEGGISSEEMRRRLGIEVAPSNAPEPRKKRRKAN